MSRDEAAARLWELAGALGQSRELERGREKLQLEVPDQVMLELEVEIKDGGAELEAEVEIRRPAGDAAPSSEPIGHRWRPEPRSLLSGSGPGCPPGSGRVHRPAAFAACCLAWAMPCVWVRTTRPAAPGPPPAA
jgi:amphi-Trp domain-containing protein